MAAEVQTLLVASQLLELARSSVYSTGLVVRLNLLCSLVDTKAKALKLLAVGATCTLTDQVQAVANRARHVAILVHLHDIGSLLADLTDLHSMVASDLRSKLGPCVHNITDVATLRYILDLASLLSDTLDEVSVTTGEVLQRVASIVQEVAEAELVRRVKARVETRVQGESQRLG